MSFQIHDFWCRRCKATTPHETTEDGQHARCVTCLVRNKAGKELSLANEVQQMRQALDGHGYTGEAIERGEKEAPRRARK
jgi:hypothetical protein